MVKARKYVVKKQIQGLPKRDDFELVEYELPPIINGEFLVKAEWISVDPYLIAMNIPNVPYDQYGYQVGVVQESKNPKYPVGTRVVSHKGWCDYAILNSEPTYDPFGEIYKLPNLHGFPNSLGVGAVGMPGVSAYFGFLEICQPKAGETVVVTGAAGAVGSLVGQIAKIKGCKVIGFAGSDEKVQWLEKELGFDKAFNYKTVDAEKCLKEATPDGIDCFFDNVGGELGTTIMQQMKTFGRISLCGSISAYFDPAKKSKGTIVQMDILSKHLRIQGFIVTQFIDQWQEGFVNLAKWIKSGQLKAVEHVTEGFDKLFDATLGMLTGDNFGKAVVKV